MQTSPAAACWAPTTVEDSVLAALLSLGRQMKQRLSSDVVDPGTFWVLHTLRCQGPSRVTDLAARSQLDASTVSRHLTQLAGSGLVERTPDPADRRAQLVKISDAGARVIDDSLEQRREALRSRLADWSRADVATLDRLLTRLSARTATSELEPA